MILISDLKQYKKLLPLTEL